MIIQLRNHLIILVLFLSASVMADSRQIFKPNLKIEMSPIPSIYIDASYPINPSGLPSALKPKYGYDDFKDEISTRSVDPNYNPSCSVISANINYNLNGTLTGKWYCFDIQTITANRVKVIAKLFNQTASSNHDLYILQWDTATQQYKTLASSVSPANADEVASAVSDSGHYVMYIKATKSTGKAFNIMFGATTQFDSYEPNDIGGDAKAITPLKQIIGNLDNPNDIDFFTYRTKADEKKIDVYAKLASNQVMFLKIKGKWVEFSTTENPKGANQNYYDVSPNTDILVAVTQKPNMPWRDSNYKVVVQKHYLFYRMTGLNILSFNPLKGRYFNQYLPYPYKDTRLPGAHSVLHIIGQLHNVNHAPAAYKRIKLSFSRGVNMPNGTTGANFEEIYFTDENGWFEITQDLNQNPYKCRANKMVLARNPRVYEPKTAFHYELDRYDFSIVSFVYVNPQEYNITSKEIFWLCGSGAPNNYTYWD